MAVKAFTDLDNYVKEVRDEIPHNMLDDSSGRYEDFQIEVSASWVLDIQKEVKRLLTELPK